MSGARPPALCLLCPFDLGRASGTPLRALATLEALRHELDPHVIATTAAGGAERLDGIWGRDGQHLALRRFWRRSLARLLVLRPDVVHCFTPVAVPPAVAARARRPHLRVVLEYHGAAEFELANQRSAVRRFFTWLDRWAVNRADAIIAMSRPQREYLRTRFSPRADPIVSWGPVDTAAHAPLPVQPHSPLVFGYFGNGHFWQGVDDLVAAAGSVREPLFRLVIAGVRPAELRLDGDGLVELAPPMDRDESMKAMGRCDVLVSPRRGGPVSDYQYPFKLSAYLAAGRPVLGTDVSDQGGIIREADCGAVVPPDSQRALAAGLQELATTSAAVRAAKGRRARSFAEANLSYDALRAQLFATYQRNLP